MHTRRFALLALFAAGCSRSFPSPPQPTTVQLEHTGNACADAGECESGFCKDGVCCSADCPASQRCDLPGSVGHCEFRPFGEACDGGQMCPGGNCVDGVCCTEPCDSRCQTCNGSQPGTCELAADDTDPRHECAGTPCSACFSGACAPVTPGSDPDSSCPSDKTCGIDQQCGGFDGGECSSSAQCAVGSCIAGACLHLDDEVVAASTMNPTADARDVVGAALSEKGDQAILFTESKNDFSLGGDGGLVVSPDENEVFLALHPVGGAWSAVPLFAHGKLASSDLLPALGRVVFLGRQALAVTQREPDDGVTCATTQHPCGMVAVAAAFTGEVGHLEEFDRSAVQVTSVSAIVDTQGHVAVIYADARGFHVRLRTAPATWITVADLATIPGLAAGSVPSLQAVGTDLYLVYSTPAPAVAVSFADGGSALSLAVGDGIDCGSHVGQFAARAAEGPALADRLAITALCDADVSSGTPGRVLLVTFSPNTSPPWDSETIVDGLGVALASSDGKWIAFSQSQGTTAISTNVGLGWEKDDGTWVERTLRTAPSNVPQPSLAMGGDGAFPFAAYGLDAYDPTHTDQLTAAPVQAGSELHAIVIRR
ncbi:MAG: hypothetical protein JST54_18395 [Deltaproteobacteria bacterium]|nr:hypothetical protein [Deltaproteobacteria bacterium]